MIIAPLWVFLVIIAIGIIYNVVYGPKRRKEAAERKRLFEKREKGGNGGNGGGAEQ